VRVGKGGKAKLKVEGGRRPHACRTRVESFPFSSVRRLSFSLFPCLLELAWMEGRWETWWEKDGLGGGDSEVK